MYPYGYPVQDQHPHGGHGPDEFSPLRIRRGRRTPTHSHRGHRAPGHALEHQGAMPPRHGAPAGFHPQQEPAYLGGLFPRGFEQLG